MLPSFLIGRALACGRSILELAGTGSVGHGGSFQQLLTEAAPVAPCCENLAMQTQYNCVSHWDSTQGVQNSISWAVMGMVSLRKEREPQTDWVFPYALHEGFYLSTKFLSFCISSKCFSKSKVSLVWYIRFSTWRRFFLFQSAFYVVVFYWDLHNDLINTKYPLGNERPQESAASLNWITDKHLRRQISILLL